MVVFGKRLSVKVAVSRAGRRAGLELAFTPAVYVLHHGRSGALVALTEHGAVNARSFKRLPESDRFVVNVPHSDTCRRRIQELTKGDDVGRARLDASRNAKQAVRHLSEMHDQCLGSNKNPDQVINFTRKKS